MRAMRRFMLVTDARRDRGISATPRRPSRRPIRSSDMRGKQAVVETSLGTFVLQLLPDAAPNHVGLFMKIARDGGFAGTAFHRVVKYAVIQGGDPFTRDPARVADWGQGGLNQVSREPNAEKHTAGAVSAVADPSRPDSAGSQFFVAVTDQPALDGQYTVFARVVDGLEIVQQISAVEADADGRPRARVDVTGGHDSRHAGPSHSSKTVRRSSAAIARSSRQTWGRSSSRCCPTRRPRPSVSFFGVAHAGIYDNTLVHRVAPGFVVQTGAINFRQTPLTPHKCDSCERRLPSSPRRPTNSASSRWRAARIRRARRRRSSSASDSAGRSTASTRCSRGSTGGAEALDRIANVPVDGETPLKPVLVTKVRIEQR